MSRYLQLNNGNKIPHIGFGTWELGRSQAANVVYHALKAGFRLIDTAYLYRNEKEVGEGIERWLDEDPENNKRSDVFYTTKLWDTQFGYENAKRSIQRAIDQVPGLEYIDLLLMHSPNGGPKVRKETYQAMQEAVDQGIVKQLGVSSWGEAHIKELFSWDGLKYKPVVNQVELSPWCMRERLVDFCHKNEILTEAYSPLARGGRFNEQAVKSIAKNKGVTPAQVLLRWSIQKGHIPIPKTQTMGRLPENIDVFGFELNDQEIGQLDHPNAHDPTDWDVVNVP
ncbi:hypothetical protein LJB42_004502 [Komagataella kurtzmanii]|nr:hypothetical protein LJB42_004502 [Komagataella kurtzmanii]